MFEAAYFSEIMRAGIQSISKGQPAAASALGLTYAQSMRYIVLPQAFRNMLPVLLTLFLMGFLDTLGTLVGVGAAGGLLDEKGDLPQIERPMLVADKTGDPFENPVHGGKACRPVPEGPRDIPGPLPGRPFQRVAVQHECSFGFPRRATRRPAKYNGILSSRVSTNPIAMPSPGL